MEASIGELELHYKGIGIIFVDDEAALVYPGDLPGVWYVASCYHADRSPACWFEFSRTPHRANMSNVACIRGWLGNTNGIDRHAIGAVRCTVRDGKAIFRRVTL